MDKENKHEGLTKADLEAHASAMLAAAQTAGREAAAKLVEQLKDDVIKSAQSAGETAAKAAAAHSTEASMKAAKAERGLQIAYYLTGTLFFVGSMVAGGMAAYRSGKSHDSAGGTEGSSTSGGDAGGRGGRNR